MYVKVDMDYFSTLRKNSWSGAIDTLNAIERADLEDEFMNLLEEEFSYGEIPTETEVNDFIWFESDYIYERLGLNEDGEYDDEEDEE